MQALCFIGFAGSLGLTAARFQSLPGAPVAPAAVVHVARPLPTPAPVMQKPILTKEVLAKSDFDIRGDTYASVSPPRAANYLLNSERRARLHRSDDGHYYADVAVNGTPIRMIVDTGATKVALSRADARKAGLLLSDKDYSASGLAVAGTIKMAPIVIERMHMGEIDLRDVSAVVFDADEGPSLLGMSFLNRMSNIEIHNNDLILKH